MPFKRRGPRRRRWWPPAASLTMPARRRCRLAERFRLVESAARWRARSDHRTMAGATRRRSGQGRPDHRTMAGVSRRRSSRERGRSPHDGWRDPPAIKSRARPTTARLPAQRAFRSSARRDHREVAGDVQTFRPRARPDRRTIAGAATFVRLDTADRVDGWSVFTSPDLQSKEIRTGGGVRAPGLWAVANRPVSCAWNQLLLPRRAGHGLGHCPSGRRVVSSSARSRSCSGRGSWRSLARSCAVMRHVQRAGQVEPAGRQPIKVW